MEWDFPLESPDQSPPKTCPGVPLEEPALEQHPEARQSSLERLSEYLGWVRESLGYLGQVPEQVSAEKVWEASHQLAQLGTHLDATKIWFDLNVTKALSVGTQRNQLVGPRSENA